MKMSPTGLPGLLVVLFVVFTTCAFFGVQFLWVLLGLGALGIGLAAVLCFVHSRMPEDVGLSLVSHGAKKSDLCEEGLEPDRNVDGIIRQIPCRVEGVRKQSAWDYAACQVQ